MRVKRVQNINFVWVALFTVHSSRRAVGPMGLTLIFLKFWFMYSTLLQERKCSFVQKEKSKQNKTESRGGQIKKQIRQLRRKTKTNRVMQNRKIRFMLRHRVFWRICWKYQKHYQYIRYMKYHTWLNPGICLEKWIVSPEPLRVLQL